MTNNTNTPKQIESVPGEALCEPENKGNQTNSPLESNGEKSPSEDISDKNQKSEISADLRVEISTPNTSQPFAAGPMFDEIEIERREQYLFNNYLG